MRFRRHGPDEIGAEVTDALDRHLAACPRCAADARTATTFDTSVAAAMRDVPVPAGLRTRLVADLSVRHAVVFRRRLYRGFALAASLLLSVGLVVGAFTAARPQPDTARIAWDADAIGDPQTSEDAVRTWLVAQRLPAQLPEPFDYGLYLTRGTEEVQGRDVPVVVFRDPHGPGFAKVYVFRSTSFDLKDMHEVQSSSCRAVPYPDRAAGVTFVVVYTGQELTPFLRGRGGRVALRG